MSGDAAYMLAGIDMYEGLHWAHRRLNKQTMQKSGLHNHAEPKNGGDAVDRGENRWQQQAGLRRVAACYPRLDVSQAIDWQ